MRLVAERSTRCVLALGSAAFGSPEAGEALLEPRAGAPLGSLAQEGCLACCSDPFLWR